MRRLLVFAAAGLCLAAPVPELFHGGSAARALPNREVPLPTHVKRRLNQMDELERPLREARVALAQCRPMDCLTPSEAVAAAITAGPGAKVPGRFLFDVRGGGPGNSSQLRNQGLFFLNSERDYRDFGVLVVVIEPAALEALLARKGGSRTVIDPRRGRPQYASVQDMMQAFEGKRVIVDGEVGLELIEVVDWITNIRTGNGYHQVWIKVTSPDQIRVVDEQPAAPAVAVPAGG